MNPNRIYTKLLFIFLFFLSISAFAQVKLPKLISNGMVLQRNTEVKIWGWAAANEQLTVHFLDNTYSATANDNGEWEIVLPEMEAGGPYEMQIDASNHITIRDIMVGDVWICSGQSNMELSMRRVSWVYEDIVADSQNPNIRQFYVPRTYNFDEPQKDLEAGSWIPADPKSVLNFSAVAYFFARELYDKYKVPIGLINSSLGGSPVEAWMSEEALKEFPAHYHEAQRYKDDNLIDKIKSADQIRTQSWYNVSGQTDQGYEDPKNAWHKPAINTSDWKTMEVPGYWASSTDLGHLNGVVWFKREFNVPPSMIGKEAKLILGRIVDADSAFINGQFVGTVSYQYPPRRYDVSSDLLREGKNNITVRVINNSGNGGFVLDKPYEIVAGDDTLDLKGDWQYKLGTEMPPLASQTFIRWKPLGLYNAMIAPLINYKMKGAIWYQGESNADRPLEYRALFPAMIRNWRNKWGQGNFPFLFVQLANFMEVKDRPTDSNWALLRESQLKTLSVSNTAMAVTIDIGEWNDIHPLNKQDVGKRLALGAQKIAYGEEGIVASGPIYRSMEIEGNKIILSFENAGSGLIAKGDEALKQFAIAGPDKNFVWAEAKIKDNKVVVWSDKVSNPVAVRYAWADNPEGANLYNKEGLPASPFRTDN